MNKFFVTVITIALLAVPSGIASVSTASAANLKDCTDPAHPGGYLAVDGMCHDAIDKAKFPPLETKPAAASSSGVVDKEFKGGDDVFKQFLADCEANGGHVYTAEDWNRRGILPHLAAGQMQCYRDPSWS